jgi:hypothetical protein
VVAVNVFKPLAVIMGVVEKPFGCPSLGMMSLYTVTKNSLKINYLKLAAQHSWLKYCFLFTIVTIYIAESKA